MAQGSIDDAESRPGRPDDAVSSSPVPTSEPGRSDAGDEREDASRRVAALEAEVLELRAALRQGELHRQATQRIVSDLRRSAEKRLAAVMPYDPQAHAAQPRLSALRDYASTSTLALLLRGTRALGGAAGDELRRRALRAHYYLSNRARRFDRDDSAHLALIVESGFFDSAFYRKTYPDVAESGVDPLLHYVHDGAAAGRDPSPLFDTAFYLRSNPDVAQAGVNPLLHYVKSGRFEGRLPRPFVTPSSVLGHWTLPMPPTRRGDRPDTVRRVIYTAVVAGYDVLAPVTASQQYCDVVAFSDRPLSVPGWDVRPLHYLHPDPTRTARFAKLHPHLLFPDHDISMWVDGNIAINGDVQPLFDSVGPDSLIGIFEHPLRNCVYIEGEECIACRRDDEAVIRAQMQSYRAEGFPAVDGLWETNVLVRRHNDPTSVALMTAWWREIELGSRRDQLSLPVVLRRAGVDVAPLGPPGVNTRTHPLLAKQEHRADAANSTDAHWPTVARKPVAFDAVSMTIGVCVHDAWEHTRDCLQSILASRRPQDRLVIVDDASGQSTAAALDAIAGEHPDVEIIRHAQNQGYTRSANDVLRAAATDWIVLVNSDAVLPRAALRKLVEAGEQFACIGMVGPLSNAASWQSVPSLIDASGDVRANALPASLTLEDMDRLCEESANGLVPFVPLVNGFCFAVRRALVERIGLFDDEAFPTGYGEEDDFCLRAAEAGFIGGIATDTYVHHVKSASFTSERRRGLVEAGRAALWQRHGVQRLQAATTMLRGNPELQRVRERLAAKLGEIQSRSNDR